jgi:hypothetical protein
MFSRRLVTLAVGVAFSAALLVHASEAYALTAAQTTAMMSTESACVQDSKDSKTPPKTTATDCLKAASTWLDAMKGATDDDAELIATNFGLFNIYAAHAIDQERLKNGFNGDHFRKTAKESWQFVADNSKHRSVREHAKQALQCFFENNGDACDKAFSATSEIGFK